MNTPNLESSQPNRMRPLIIGLLVLLICAAVALLAASLMRPEVSVTLIIEGAAQTITVRAQTVAEALQASDVALGGDDAIEPAPSEAIADGAVIRITRARNVMLTVDGVTRIVSTTLTQPGAILAAQDIVVSPDDQVHVNDLPVSADALNGWDGVVSEISVRHAQPFTLTEILPDGQAVTRALMSSAETLGQALFDLDMTIYLADALDPPADSPLTNGLEVVLDRAMQVMIQVEGERLEVRIQQGVVADALASAGIALMAADFTRPALEMPLTTGMLIEVVRVNETLTTRFESIPYETLVVLHEDAGSMSNVAGAPGVLQVVIRNRAEDGIAVSRQEISRTTLATPSPEILYVDEQD